MTEETLAIASRSSASESGDPAVGGQPSAVVERARHVRLVLTDSDGLLTDNGVYYSPAGEEMKRFSIRDGMGVERLRVYAGVEVGIITGERSGAVQRRAEKLGITELHLGIRDKVAVLDELLARRSLTAEQVAYIGDDTLWASICRLVVARRTVVHVHVESLQLPGADRRELAARC